MRSWDLRGTLFLGVNILCWGSVPVLLRGLADPSFHVDAWLANGIRYPMAAALYWPVLWFGIRAGRVNRSLALRAVPPALFSLGGQIFWAQAPYYLEAGMISFLIQLSIVWGVCGAMILFPDERPLLRSPAFYVGSLAAVAGTVVLSISRGALEGGTTQTGVLIITICGVLFAGYSVSVRKFLRDDPPLAAFGVVAQYVAAGCLAILLAWGTPSAAAGIDGKGWAMLGASSLLGIGLAHVFLYGAMQRLGASISQMARLVLPFLTMFIAWLALGETLSPIEWAAGIAMVAGGALILSSQGRVHGAEA